MNIWIAAAVFYVCTFASLVLLVVTEHPWWALAIFLIMAGTEFEHKKT